MNQSGNILQERRGAKLLKIPKGLTAQHLSDIKELKIIALYCELKPLFYDGQIHQAKSRYNEISEYLGIGNSTLRLYLKRMLERGLITYKGKHLQLCSWKQFFDLYSLNYYGGKSFFYIENRGETQNRIRAIYCKNNTEKQKYKFWQKFFISELHKDHVNETFRREIATIATTTRSNPDTLQRFTERMLDKLRGNKQFRRYYNKFKDDPHNLFKAFQIAIKEMEIGNDIPTNNPFFTLSCQGVARVLGKRSRSVGHYWEQKLKEAGMIQIQATTIRSTASAYNRQFWEGISLGVYKKRWKSGNQYSYFQNLSNQLIFTL